MQDLEHRKVPCRQVAIEFFKINLPLRSRLYWKERRPSILLYANNVNSREQQKNALFQEQIFLSGCFEWGIIYSMSDETICQEYQNKLYSQFVCIRRGYNSFLKLKLHAHRWHHTQVKELPSSVRHLEDAQCLLLLWCRIKLLHVWVLDEYLLQQMLPHSPDYTAD
jgi:hypothetical protein